MSKIILMDETLSNMIAAGEVVERPSSVVKELVENSIDANSTHIVVEIKNNGLDLVSVKDDGTGMDKEDTKLAFLRHATSKIKVKQDLTKIKTLGFRGEALASISSVSKVIIKTKTKDSEPVCLQLENNQIIDLGSTPLNQGTIIEVYDLFYNTPARFKYLKSEQQERLSIIETFDKLALANPGISFTLIIDDKHIKQTAGNNDIVNTMSTIYGLTVTKDLFEVDFEIQKINIKGYLVSPHNTRSKKKDINIFINNRYIKNYVLTDAVIEGYHSFLMTNRYPICVLYITMDPSLIDVNCHPQKTVCKMVNEQLLKFLLQTKIQETLNQTKIEFKTLNEQPNEQPNELPKIIQNPIYIKESFDLDDSTPQTIAKEEIPLETFDKIPDFDYIGTFWGTYLLFQNEKGLYMIDQHAAQERVEYEKYYEIFSENKKLAKQFLIKHPLKVNQSDLEIVTKNTKLLEEYNFIIDKDTLTAIPHWLEEKDIDNAFEIILEQIKDNNQISLIKLRDSLAKMISCKSSVKANQQLSNIEIKELISQLKKAKNPYYCPHGRPTIVLLTNYDIEKLFKRVV